ncbi:MAG: alpha-L-rhamnosidase N-terminal domain-containing protein, partial [Bacteroidota bacterium]
MKGEKQGKHIFSRRNFFKKSALGSTSLFIPPSIFHSNTQIKADKLSLSPRIQSPVKSRWYLDLSPAKWIWYPAERTLTNTFFLFRKQLIVTKPVKQATGWILGESRYLLFCNGQRIQFGPAPADPRYTEADPLDLTKELQQGENIIAVQVMYYGWGDGTLPVGKYGLLFQLKLQFEDGSEEWVVSDDSWKVCLAKSWQPGQYKRWYLRALQEEFDARLHPYGWGGNQFTENEDWLTVKVIGEKANSPSLSTNADDYLYNASGDAAQTELRKRMIPLVKEEALPIKKLVELQSVKWQRSPEEYFDLLTENAFAKGEKQPKLLEIKQGEAWEVSTEIKEEGFVVTFELDEQVVGWPYFIIEASEGTTIELMVQEGHQTYSKGGPLIMNNHFHSWTRFICKAGFN